MTQKFACQQLISPWECGSRGKSLIFKLNVQNSSLCTRCDIALRWMPKNLTYEKSTLNQYLPEPDIHWNNASRDILL